MKKIVLISALCLFVGFVSSAGLAAADWKSLGVQVIEEKKDGERSTVQLQDAKNRKFTLVFIGEPKPAQLKRALALKDRILGWDFVAARSLRILMVGDALDVHLLPATFACGKQDVLPYLPGGIIMRQSGDVLNYNFRLVVKNVFVRIKGVFAIVDKKKKGAASGSEICGKVVEALANPAAYARKRDPEYILRKLDELENRLEKLKLANERLRASRDRLRYALITLHNAGFFSGPTPPNAKAVARVVELKTADPKLKVDAIVTRLTAEKLPISSKVVRLVFAAYFNDFGD